MRAKSIEQISKSSKCQVKKAFHCESEKNANYFISNFLASDISPPGEDLLPHEPVIYRLFDKFKEAPLIGIEYIVEIIHGPNVDPTYECLLCHKSLDSKDVISCIISAKHRLNYLEKFYPIARAKFAQVPNMDLWERPTYDFLESVAMRIEEKHGRLSVTNITKSDYDSNKEFIFNRIEDGPHFRYEMKLENVIKNI